MAKYLVEIVPSFMDLSYPEKSVINENFVSIYHEFQQKSDMYIPIAFSYYSHQTFAEFESFSKNFMFRQHLNKNGTSPQKFILLENHGSLPITPEPNFPYDYQVSLVLKLGQYYKSLNTNPSPKFATLFLPIIQLFDNDILPSFSASAVSGTLAVTAQLCLNFLFFSVAVVFFYHVS